MDDIISENTLAVRSSMFGDMRELLVPGLITIPTGSSKQHCLKLQIIATVMYAAI
jgi:hypothetical protein